MTMTVDPQGPLHSESGPQSFWSTTNVGEALPGVASPLCWSLWGPAVELGVRDCFARMGALERDQVLIPPHTDDRLTAVFFGRAALNVNFFCRMGGRLPGTGPDAIAKQLLGEVPAGIPLSSTRERLPAVAVKMPHALVTIRRDVIARTAPTKTWWANWLGRIDSLDEAGAQRALADAQSTFTEMIRVQAGGVFIAVQSVYDQLLALIEKAELDPAAANALVAGQGSHAETEMIFDLWAMGRGKLTEEQFIARHGYHGPFAGEVSSVVWREDPSPVRHLAKQYAGRTDEQNPAEAAAERTRARIAAEQKLLAGLPAMQRPGAKLVLKLAVSRIPLRGVAKAAYLQSLDIARASARRLGGHLAQRGVLSDPEDVFMFGADELIGGVPENAAEIAGQRRAQREEFQRHDIPTHWSGNPTPFELAPRDAESKNEAVSGTGASGGVAEGVVRVVHDPAFTDIEPDEVLVCVTTDPSWASVLFISSALVVDIGGLLSHAAVVAREVGVPCVIGTGNGTSVLRTGDRVRVDGNAGTVELLQRAQAPDDAVTGTASVALPEGL